MSLPLISVIVAVYNVEQYVAKCIDSIISQTYRNFECIIVNDGSTDKSRDICINYSLIDKRIRIIDKINGGLSSARNMGIDSAKGEFFAFVDSDDWIEPNMFEILMHYALEFQTEIVVCGHFVVSEKSIEPIRNDGKVDIFTKEQALSLILEDKDINSFAWDKLYRSSLFKSIRYPIGRIYEDIATTYKLFAISDSVVKINIPLYNYRRRIGSISLSNNTIRPFHIFLAFFERYEYAKENSLLIKDVCCQYVIKHAVNAIDNFALASKMDRNSLGVNTIIENILNVINEDFIKVKGIPRFKLSLFEFNPSLYCFLYKIFHFLKRILL